MSDLIDRKAVIGLAKDICVPTKDGKYRHRSIDPIDVMELPSVNTEQKKGKWIKEYWNSEHTRKCSECNITQTVPTYMGKVIFNYCPYCGADMRGDHE